MTKHSASLGYPGTTTMCRAVSVLLVQLASGGCLETPPALEAARGSFEAAHAAVTRRCGPGG